MILSVSRRTDIPAFYSKWFLNRLKAGYLLVRNPMNHKQVSKISLKPEDVECLVFWTKNPKPLLDHLQELEGYTYYFQVTITSYGDDIEKGVPSFNEIIEITKALSLKIGKEKVIWRYDPIIVTEKYDEIHHLKKFEAMAKSLSGYTDKCVISFVDSYKKTEKNMKEVGVRTLLGPEMIKLAEGIQKIANQYNIVVETCSEKIDLSSVGVKHGKCVDDELIARLIGINGTVEKDPNQRETCGCVSSVDVGTYNSCPHMCKYCYANTSVCSAIGNYNNHIQSSELLFGELDGTEIVYDRKIVKHFTNYQLDLFDTMK